jgi:polysaccharide biosynthesis protein PslG
MKRLVVILVLAALALPATAAAKPHPFYGVSSQTALGPGDYKKMSKAHIGTLRAVLLWSGVNPTQNGAYAWSGFDTVVADAARQRIRVLPFIFGTPSWVARNLDNRKCGACDAYAPRHRAALAAWKQFVGAAVDRYGRGGDFWAEHPELPRMSIRAWQIWNEQNSKTFYRPKPTTKGYAKLLHAASSAIQAHDRKADVVLGGMAELAGSRKAVKGHEYLHDLYNRHGIKRDFDGIAVHPYGAKASAVETQAQLFVDEARDAHDGKVGLWVTETGWGSSNGSNPLEVGRRGQADRLRDAYRWFTRERHRMHIKTVVWFSWRDSAQSICAWCASSGLLKKSGRPKPAYRMMKRVAG